MAFHLCQEGWSDIVLIEKSELTPIWLAAREITAGGVGKVRALRVNYVGELDWELHCLMPNLPRLFDALMEAGGAHGLTLFGA